MKKLATILISIACLCLFAACSSTGSNSLAQFDMPQDGEEIAVIETSMGTIRLRLFPDAAPKAVENFTTLAKDGYYDGLIFHRVIDNFMIQGGDPEGTGLGGESIWGEGFGEEFSFDLHHVRGALAMAKSAQPNSQGSQFYIVQSPMLGTTESSARSTDAALTNILKKKDEQTPVNKRSNPSTVGQAIDNNLVNFADKTGKTGLKYGQFFDEAIVAKYREVGGAPMLDFGYTVFGQAFEGLEVLDKITAVETDKADKPLEDVYIISIKIEAYSAK